MQKKIIIVGLSSTAQHAYDFIQDYELYDVVAFAVDKEYKDRDSFNGLPVITFDELENNTGKTDIYLFVAIMWNRLNKDRRDVYEKLKNRGFRFVNLISPYARIRGKIQGENCWIHDYVVVQSEATVGENCFLMAYSLVGPSSNLGSHCFMGTKSTVAGNCEVGEQSFIGINSTVFDDTKIGDKCIIGACTAIKRNVDSYTLVKTNQGMNDSEYLGHENIENKLLHYKNKR